MVPERPTYYCDLMAWPLQTDVLGDIERWAAQYLDTGQHVCDWCHLMAIQRGHWQNYGARTADYDASEA